MRTPGLENLTLAKLYRNNGLAVSKSLSPWSLCHLCHMVGRIKTLTSYWRDPSARKLQLSLHSDSAEALQFHSSSGRCWSQFVTSVVRRKETWKPLSLEVFRDQTYTQRSFMLLTFMEIYIPEKWGAQWRSPQESDVVIQGQSEVNIGYRAYVWNWQCWLTGKVWQEESGLVLALNMVLFRFVGRK